MDLALTTHHPHAPLPTSCEWRGASDEARAPLCCLPSHRPLTALASPEGQADSDPDARMSRPDRPERSSFFRPINCHALLLELG